jgi:hypothetical protein
MHSASFNICGVLYVRAAERSLRGFGGWTQYCLGCGLSPLSLIRIALELIYPLKQEVDSHAGRPLLGLVRYHPH